MSAGRGGGAWGGPVVDAAFGVCGGRGQDVGYFCLRLLSGYMLERNWILLYIHTPL